MSEPSSTSSSSSDSPAGSAGSAGSTSHPRLAHVGLTVSDLDRAIAFYQAALGAEVSERGSDGRRSWAFLEVDGDEALTLWQLGDGEPTTPGLHHLAFQMPDEATLRAAHQSLAELDTPFVYVGVVPHAEGSPSAGIFFLDGDGLQVEMYADLVSTDATAPNGSNPTCGFF